MSTAFTLHDLERLERLYVAGFHDTFLDNALHKVVARQIARDEADLARVDAALAKFERQYGLTSDEFWQRFQSGQMADDPDLMEWNVFCKMRQRIVSRLRILHGDGSHE